MAVLFEFPTLNGGERSMLALLQMLIETGGFRFTAVAPEIGPLGDQLRSLRIPIVPFCVRQHGHKRSVSDLHAELLAILTHTSPHLLHSNSLSMSRLIGQWTLPSHLPVRRTGHLRDIVRLNRTVIGALNQNDVLIAVSRATCDYHIQQGLQPQLCHVIHNGVDTENFQPRDKLTARRRLLPELSESAQVLLNVGQICLRKGQLDLARATCSVLEDLENVHLVIVGERHSEKSESIAFEESIRGEFAARRRLKHVHFVGYRSDVAEWMNASDVLVHAARQEPFGRTLLEAAASGLPIVATDVGGTSEMLEHNRDALLVPSSSPQALSQAITQLLCSPDRAGQLAESARVQVQRRFTVQRMADQTAALWRSALERRT